MKESIAAYAVMAPTIIRNPSDTHRKDLQSVFSVLLRPRRNAKISSARSADQRTGA